MSSDNRDWSEVVIILFTDQTRLPKSTLPSSSLLRTVCSWMSAYQNKSMSTCVANANFTVHPGLPYLPLQGCDLSKLCWFSSYVDMIVLKELKWSLLFYFVQNSIYVKIIFHYQNRIRGKPACWSVLTVKHPWGETVYWLLNNNWNEDPGTYSVLTSFDLNKKQNEKTLNYFKYIFLSLYKVFFFNEQLAKQ